MQNNRVIYKLDDSVIAQIVKIIQIGFLTGTDVSDHMRLLRVEAGKDKKEGAVVLTPEYVAKDAADIDAMFEHLEDRMEAEDKN